MQIFHTKPEKVQLQISDGIHTSLANDSDLCGTMRARAWEPGSETSGVRREVSELPLKAESLPGSQQGLLAKGTSTDLAVALGMVQAPGATIFLHQPFRRFGVADDGFGFGVPVNLFIRSHRDVAKMAYRC